MTAQFTSSDSTLAAGWAWATEQAMAYVRHDDPVGDWFEAALPGRNAFCMRDVSHQAAGAQVLGLRTEVKTMLRRFAENIAQSRDWCSYWEISGDNLPAEVDYTDDTDFWYNLPANFDVLECCWRQYLWTGDADYVSDPVFLNYYERTLNEYVRQWDTDGDGIPEHLPQYGRRGIASYEEAVGGIRIGGDLVAAQVAAYEAFVNIQALRGDAGAAGRLQASADTLRAQYERGWWNADRENYYSILHLDGQFSPQPNFGINTFALYFRLVRGAARIGQVMDDLIRQFPNINVESQSYFPEVAYAYGYHQAAYNALCYLVNPALPRREYPEVSYSVLGAMVNGLMGVTADARHGLIRTTPRLTPATESASLTGLPMLSTVIDLSHAGTLSSTLRNRGETPVTWEAHFPTSSASLLLNDVPQAAAHRVNGVGQPEAILSVQVPPGGEMTIAVP